MSQPKVTKEKLRLPGIETLHTRSKEEIAETLATVLKSRTNITSLTFIVGSHIELTLE